LIFRKKLDQAEVKEMGFLDHLEELRWHLMKAAIAILVCMIVAFIYMPDIFKIIILGPSRPDFWTYQMMCRLGPSFCIDKIDFVLQSRNMSGQFSMHITASFVVGLVMAFPYVFYQIWSFIKPALYPGEKKFTSGSVFFVSMLFAAGILFGYYLIAPLSINFLANYKLDPSITNQFDVTSYVSTLCMLVLGSGLMFQLPVLIYVLSVMGIMTPEFMKKYRKHAIVVNFILAAFITPSPDILTMALVAFPLIFLYEISIFISASATKKREFK
jgi:sec-independent protein translocase protein TatC